MSYPWAGRRLAVLAVVWIALALFQAVPAAADKKAGDDAFEANDYKKAFKELLPEAQRGDRRSQYRIGWMYLNGEGTAQNEAKAIFWLTKSGEQKYARAQAELGEIYVEGRGVKADVEQGGKWLRLAADNGNSDAMYELGDLYLKGHGVRQGASRKPQPGIGNPPTTATQRPPIGWGNCILTASA